MSVATLLNTPLTRSTHPSPTRAITSTLVNRSAPSIPPPNQTYEPLVKSVLRQRLTYNLFLNAYIIVWPIVGLLATWKLGGVNALGLHGAFVSIIKLPTTSLLAVFWFVGIVPPVLLRKVYLTGDSSINILMAYDTHSHGGKVHPSIASSPSKTLHAAFSKAGAQRALIVYIISAICLTSLQIFMAYKYESSTSGDPHLRLLLNQSAYRCLGSPLVQAHSSVIEHILGTSMEGQYSFSHPKLPSQSHA